MTFQICYKNMIPLYPKHDIVIINIQSVLEQNDPSIMSLWTAVLSHRRPIPTRILCDSYCAERHDEQTFCL